MLMRRRTRYSVLVALSVFALLGVALVLRFHAPPEVARLLPESDAIVYFNLKTVRAASHFDQRPVTPSAEYQKFIEATDIRFDRDLDRAAFSLHRMPDPNGPNGPVAYSEVMEGRFDAKRLTAWLTANATAQETYAGHTLYIIPVEGRSLRVTTLGYDMVAASNMPTAEQVHSIIDRYVAGASPFSGSSLLSARYSDVPLFSLAWGIGHVGLPFSENGKISVFGLQLPMGEDTDLIASLSFRGSLHLRVEEIASTAPVAVSTAQNLQTILNIVRGFGPTVATTPEDKAMHDVLNSLEVSQHNDRVILTGNVSPELLQMLSRPSPEGPSLQAK
jgi:hypothetical protein